MIETTTAGNPGPPETIDVSELTTTTGNALRRSDTSPEIAAPVESIRLGMADQDGSTPTATTAAPRVAPAVPTPDREAAPGPVSTVSERVSVAVRACVERPVAGPAQMARPHLPFEFGEAVLMGELVLVPMADEGTSARWLSEPGWFASYTIMRGNPAVEARVGRLELVDARSLRAPSRVADAVPLVMREGADVSGRTTAGVALVNDGAGQEVGSVELRSVDGRNVWIILRAGEPHRSALLAQDLSVVLE
ncbi:MAG: hypothetical protein ACKV2O_15945 [Acidimicrobiales bacterium]